MIRRQAKWVIACILTLWLPNNSQGSQGKPDENMIPVHSRMGKAENLISKCKNVENINPDGKTVPLKDAPEVMTCLGYISGILDLADFDQALPPAHTAHGWCLPDGASSSQVAKVIVKYANDHPEELHLPAVLLVANALLKAFPCG